MGRLVLVAAPLALVACSQGVEQQMVAAADRINAEKPHNVEWARADGRKLILHFAGSTSAALSNDEMARVASAGLCSLDEIRATMRQGGSIQIEVGSDFGAAVTNVDHCPSA